MPRSQMRHTVRDASGNVIQNALVHVYETGTTTPVDDMFAAASGGAAITTLTSNAQGEVEGWFDEPRVVDLKVTDNGDTAFYPSQPSRLLQWADITETLAISLAPAAYQLTSEKGAANGYASLDAGGLVPDEQLPAGLGSGLPAGIESSDAYTAVAGQQLNACDATTGFAVTNAGVAIALDTTNKQEGTGSVSFGLWTNWNNNPNLTSKGWVDLTAAQPRGDFTHVQFWFRWADDGPGVGPDTEGGKSISDVVQFKVSEGAGLTGTSVVASVPELTQNTWARISVRVTDLTQVRSVGVITIDGNTGTSYRAKMWFDDIAFQPVTEVQRALVAAGADGGVIVSPSFAPSVPESRPDLLVNQTVLDMRADRPYLARAVNGGARSIRELALLDEEGGTAANGELSLVLAGLADGETVVFPPNATYLMDDVRVVLRGLDNVTIDFGGATFYSTVRRLAPFFEVTNCSRLTFRNFRMFGYRSDTVVPALLVSNSGNLLTQDQADLEVRAISGWASKANCSVVVNSDGAYQGVYGLTLTSSAAGDFSATTPTGTNGFAVEPSVSYTFSGWTRIKSNLSLTRTIRLDVEWYTAAGALIQTDTAASDVVSQSTTIGGFRQLSGAVTAPGTAAFAALVPVVVGAVGSGEVIHFDMMRVLRTSNRTLSGQTLTTRGDGMRQPIPGGRGTNEIPFYGRDKDGFNKFDIILSDSAQVANDCVIAIEDADTGEVYASRTLTLTATPTTYTITWKAFQLDRRLKFHVWKNTNTTNTITVGSLTEYGRVEYIGTYEFAAGILVSGGTNDLLIEDGHVENIGGDAVQVGAATARRTTVRRVDSVACSRQGMSFNRGAGFTISDIEIHCPDRSGIDVEPFGTDWVATDVLVRNVRMWQVRNYAMAMANWARVLNFRGHDIICYSSRLGFVSGGARGGGFYDCAQLETTNPATAEYDAIINGIDFEVVNFTAKWGARAAATTITSLDKTYVPKNVIIRGSRTIDSGKYAAVTGGDDYYVSGFAATQDLDWSGTTTYVGPAELGSLYNDIHPGPHYQRYPNSWKGVGSRLWFPGGLGVLDEPVYGVRGLSGQRSEITVLASGTRTTGATGASVDNGAPAQEAHLHLSITAASGSRTSLDVSVEHSPDNTTWFPLATFPVADKVTSRAIRVLGVYRHLRAVYTISGTTPSFTFAVRAVTNTKANNLRGIAVPVTLAATTKTVAFTSRTLPTNNFNLVAATGGSLTSSTTYFYRVACGDMHGGPRLAAAEKSVALNASQNAVTITGTTFRDETLGIAAPSLTVYRGTATGVYGTRFDFKPNNDWWSFYDFAVKDEGTRLTFTPTVVKTWGYPTSVASESGSFTPADESGWEYDTNYGIVITPNWLTTHRVSAKRRDGFDVEFGTVAPTNATFDWLLVR